MNYTMRTKGDMQDRLLSKMHVDENGCWIWGGNINAGYGRLCYEKKGMLAHRASFEAFNSPITDGLFVCHSCDVSVCINPEHLWLGTQKENLNDASNKGRLKKSDNVCKKISDGLIGRPVSSETRKKLSDSLKRYNRR